MPTTTLRGTSTYTPDLQSVRAANSRPPSSTRGSCVPSRSTVGSIAFATRPVIGSTFTWERAEASQCVAHTPYAVNAAGPEAAYFAPLLARCLVDVARVAPRMCVLPLLDEAARAMERDASALSMHSIEYGQLQPVTTPDLSARTPPANLRDYAPATEYDEYLGFYKGKESHRMVQAPSTHGGEHYAIVAKQLLPYSLTLTAALRLDGYDADADGAAEPGIEYAAQFVMKKLGKLHCLDACDTPNDVAIFVSVGEMLHGKFKPWQVRIAAGQSVFSVAIRHDELLYKLFYQSKNGADVWPRAGVVEPERDEAEEILQRAVDVGSRCRFNLQERNGYMAFFVKGEGSGAAAECDWVRVCNFVLHRFACLYNFSEDDHGRPF